MRRFVLSHTPLGGCVAYPAEGSVDGQWRRYKFGKTVSARRYKEGTGLLIVVEARGEDEHGACHNDEQHGESGKRHGSLMKRAHVFYIAW